MGLLRVILAIAVVIAHSNSFFGIKITGGEIAVQMFYIISGFYMTMILDRKYVGSGSYKLFLSNRMLKLFPIYWVILILTILVSLFSFISQGNWARLLAYAKYIDVMSTEAFLFQITTNIFLFGQDIVMFIGMNSESGELFFSSSFQDAALPFYVFLLVPQAWTLGIELLFYLVAPFLVKKSNLFVFFLISLSLLARVITYLYFGFNNDPWTYRFFPFELALFLMGTISYRIYTTLISNDFLGLNFKKGISAVFFGIVIFYQYLFFQSEMAKWIIYLLFACFFLPIIFSLSKSSILDGRLAELSYPIYISHLFIIFLITPIIRYLDIEYYKGELSIGVTILVSYILVRFISDPVEKFRQSRVKLTYRA